MDRNNRSPCKDRHAVVAVVVAVAVDVVATQRLFEAG